MTRQAIKKAVQDIYLYRLLDSLWWEVKIWTHMRKAAKAGIRYQSLEAGMFRMKVVHQANAAGTKQFRVNFPSGKTKTITVSYERGYEDIDGTAHKDHYIAAMSYARNRGRVVDCACGSGYGSAILANEFLEVVGFDINPDAIDYASERYPRTNLRFINADATALTEPLAGVDLITCIETMEHVKDDLRMLRCFHDMLSPNGVLYVTVPNSPDLSLTSPYHEREYEPQRFLELLASVFGSSNVTLKRNPRYFIGVCAKL